MQFRLTVASLLAAAAAMAPAAPALAQDAAPAATQAVADASDAETSEAGAPETATAQAPETITPTPVTAVTAAATPASEVRRPLTPYRINPGDEVEIFVWGEERLQRVVKVLPDGTFSFPLVGRVDALNKLPTELETVIAKGLETQYRGAVPQVTVSVRAPSGLQFTVVGKVRGPGTFTPGRYVNILEALTYAGGPSEFAQIGNIIILRKDGTGLTRIPVRLNETYKGAPTQGDLTGGLPQIQGGDTVIVP